MLIKNVSVLLGKELEFVSNTNIKIQNSKFKRIQPKIRSSAKEPSIDCEGLLLIPGFINCHTHIGDSIGKDITLNSTMEQRVHPVSGIKSKILKETDPKHLKNFIENSCRSMLKKGITTFVDFREGGLEGITILKDVLKNLPIRSIILGRLEFYQNHSEIKKNISFPKNLEPDLAKILSKCDGLGISGANENSNSTLHYYSKTSKNKSYSFLRDQTNCKHF